MAKKFKERKKYPGSGRTSRLLKKRKKYVLQWMQWIGYNVTEDAYRALIT